MPPVDVRDLAGIEPAIGAIEHGGAGGNGVAASLVVRLAQDPPFGEPCEVAVFPERWVDAGIVRYAPLVGRQIAKNRPGMAVSIVQRPIQGLLG